MHVTMNVMYIRIFEYLFMHTSNFICMHLCGIKLKKPHLNKSPPQINALGLAPAKN